MKKQIFLPLLLLLLSACSAGETSEPENDPADSPESAVTDIQVAVAADDFAIGSPRIPFVLYSGVDQVADVQAIDLTALNLSVDPPAAGWQGQAINYSDYEVPYWVVVPDIESPGPWGLAADLTLADGTKTRAQFAVQVAEVNQSPALGEQAPASFNRTLNSVEDIGQLTSGQDPEPGLYQMTVAEAIHSGDPTVVILATPAFCQTKICAPVVRSVETVYDEFGQDVNFIHLEIYKEFDPLVAADEVEEWGITSEPWTFILDRTGKVVFRLGGPVSPRELTESLTPLIE
jgi:hypothetical protein